MPSTGHVAPLLEWELYDTEAEMSVRENVFRHRVLNTETLGDAWCGAHARPQEWFNPAVGEREWREYCEIRDREFAERQKHARERAQEREALATTQERAAYQREVVDAARRAEVALAEYERKQADRRREEAVELERKRLWAIHTSAIEHRIVMIVDTIEASAKDRHMMRAILRYMNLGPGVGTQWDLGAFANYYARIDPFHYYVAIDAARCYMILKYRNVAGMFECLSLSTAT